MGVEFPWRVYAVGMKLEARVTLIYIFSSVETASESFCLLFRSLKERTHPTCLGSADFLCSIEWLCSD